MLTILALISFRTSHLLTVIVFYNKKTYTLYQHRVFSHHYKFCNFLNILCTSNRIISRSFNHCGNLTFQFPAVHSFHPVHHSKFRVPQFDLPASNMSLLEPRLSVKNEKNVDGLIWWPTSSTRVNRQLPL